MNNYTHINTHTHWAELGVSLCMSVCLCGHFKTDTSCFMLVVIMLVLLSENANLANLRLGWPKCIT